MGRFFYVLNPAMKRQNAIIAIIVSCASAVSVVFQRSYSQWWISSQANVTHANVTHANVTQANVTQANVTRPFRLTTCFSTPSLPRSPLFPGRAMSTRSGSAADAQWTCKTKRELNSVTALGARVLATRRLGGAVDNLDLAQLMNSQLFVNETWPGECLLTLPGRLYPPTSG